jgi:tetratricopeptide (TPR) repeat protein
MKSIVRYLAPAAGEGGGYKPPKHKIATAYRGKLGDLLQIHPDVSVAFTDKALGGDIRELMDLVGAHVHTIDTRDEDVLIDEMIYAEGRGHLVFFQYRPARGGPASLIQALRQMKERAPLFSHHAIVPVFTEPHPSARRREILQQLARFGVRYAIFLDGSHDMDLTLTTFMEEVVAFKKLLGGDFVVDEPEPVDAPTNDVASVERYRRLLAEGDELVSVGEFEKAVERFSQALDLAPDFSALIKRGDAFFRMKKYAAALSDYREAHRLSVTAPDPYAKMSACCFVLTRQAARMKDETKAAKWFEMGVESLAKATALLADVTAQHLPSELPPNPYGAVVFALTEAETRETGLPDASRRIEKVAAEIMGRIDGVDFLDRHLDVFQRIDAATLFARAKRYEKAEAIFRDVTAQDPANAVPAFNNYAVELRKNGDYGRAYGIYKDLLGYDVSASDREVVEKNMMTAGRRYAQHLREEGTSDQAVPLYEELLERTPKGHGREWLLCDLALTHLESQNQSDASARMMEAMYLNPNLMNSATFAKNYPDLGNLKAEMLKKLTDGAL